MRLFGRVLDRIGVGSIRLETARGLVREFEGHEPGPAVNARINRNRVAWRFLRGGDTGLLESYMDGDWDTDDLADFLTWGAMNEEAFGEVLNGLRYARVFRGILHALNRNSRAGSRRNIARHYDLGNDFYALWLDPTMTYSSGIFATSDATLEQAQIEKYRRMLARLDLRSDHHLLEIGSGWGGFALYAAQQTGCRVTSITLSKEQLDEARRRAQVAGLADRVRFEYRDYRDVDQTYDRVVSIEMFEAVGEEFWPVYFKTLHDRLVPGGRAALQVITIDDDCFEDYRRGVDFIQRYIFPGGMLPSPKVFESHVEGAGLRTVNRDFFGQDYAETLAYWDRNVTQVSDRLIEMGYDMRFQRMWHAYLAYCQAGFRLGRIDVMQTALIKS
ncbi:MAG: cyclopropane-fatty-acyl-phospholipid synthase family protein [Pseudomonadota bacterium]|nr:cyclopropane-fatty-acyl-phospholipid synthase family protein [Pseudomonadota bacterium]